SLALMALGFLASMRCDYAASTAILEESRVAVAAVLDHRLSRILEGWILTNLAFNVRSLGDHALPPEYLEAALRYELEAEYGAGIVEALGDLGDFARDRGDHEQALERYREALR